MSKSGSCDERSRNLARQTCTRKTNLLVYEKQKGEDNKPKLRTYVPPITSPRIRRIRICTAAELKKICAPPPCPCPPRPPPLTLIQRIMKLAGFGLKGLLVAGTMYITYDMGIWGDSATTGELYKSVCDVILPKLVEPITEKPVSPACQAESELFKMYGRDPYCCDKFPIDSESGMYEIKQKWNKVVTGTFAALVGVPIAVNNSTKKAYCKVFNSESCKEKVETDENCVPCEYKG